MKATTIIITAILSLQVSKLFAYNDIPVRPTKDVNSSGYVSLMPTTPTEATFEDDATLTNVATLAPVTPMEADFSDTI